MFLGELFAAEFMARSDGWNLNNLGGD